MIKKCEKIVLNNKKNAILAIILFLMLIYSCYIYGTYVLGAATMRTPESSINNLNEIEIEQKKMNMSDTIVQEFIGDYKGISAIQIKLGDQQQGKLQIKLIQRDSGKEIQQWNKSIKNNKNGVLKLKLNKKQKNTDGVAYLLEITLMDNSANDICVTTEDKYLEGFCYYNQEYLPGDLLFNIVPVKQNYNFLKYTYWIIVFVMLSITVMCFYFLQRQKITKIENLFVLFTFFFGSVYLLILPPFSAPDEPRHYATAYHTSNIILGVEEDDEKYVVCRECDNDSVLGLSPTAETYRVVAHNLGRKSHNTEIDSKFVIGSTIEGAPVIAHLPQAIGLTIARIMKLNYITSIYFAQLFCLIFYTITVYLAIKLIPVGKYIIFALSGLPMMLQEAASCSYDIIITGLVYLFVAYVLNLVYNNHQVKIKDIVIMLLLAVLFSPCKLVYCVVCFLVLIIPKENFKNNKYRMTLKIGVPLCGLSAAIINNINAVSESAGATKFISWAGEEGYTISYLLSHVSQTINLFLTTYHDKFAFYVGSLVGTELGWFDINIPLDLTVASVVILVLAINNNEKPINVLTRHKLLFMGIFLCSSLLICTSMLLGWTPISYRAIEGVQGRYFLPVIPMALFCFIDKRKNHNYNRNVIVLGTCIVNFLVVIRIFETVILR